MNKKIKELLSTVHTDVSGKWVSTDELESVAELVLNEVRSVINDVYHKVPLEHAVHYHYMSDIIDEHFYVEESVGV